jgi:bifunctional ADP-heptose synthase (sugar kinase/adenylyltransferase)
MLEKLIKKDSPEQLAYLDKLRSNYSMDDIIKLINKISSLDILVVGEPIIDSYIFCQVAGISSKSPTISTCFEYKEDYAGGSLAIANHIKHLGCNVEMLITRGDDECINDFILSFKEMGINITSHMYQGIPTPKKTRYLSTLRNEKLFELMEIKSDVWQKHNPDTFCQSLLELSKNKDTVLICDYGHGMFETKVLETIAKIETPIALNVQANSENFGYNLYTKHKHFDYLSIDEREFRLAAHDRYNSAQEIAHRCVEEGLHTPLALTIGKQGSLYFDENKESCLCPAFIKDTVDTTGAGDAFFAITTLLVKLDAPADLIPFIGNAYAGLQTRIVGNKSPVTKDELILFIDELFK